MMASPLGLLVSIVYLSLQNGFSAEKLANPNFLALWEQSPFVVGELTDAYVMALASGAASTCLILLCVLIFLYRPDPNNAHGTARWASDRELIKKGYFQPYSNIIGPILGKSCRAESGGKYLTNGPHPHILVSAPTRAGKGVGVVIPTMLTHNGSSVVLDVKGELFDLTSRSRQARGDRVFKFSPLDPQGRTHRYNPVEDIAATSPERRFIEARRLAASLIVPKGKGAEGFVDGARDLLVAGILAAIERGTPTIGAVYDLFSQPGEKYQLFAKLAEETNSIEARRIFDNMAGNDTKILTSYTSVLGDGGLNLWADQLVKNATEKSDFDIHALRREPHCIYIVVSPNDIEVLSPLVRLLFQQTVAILQRTLPNKDEIFEVLFLLDEFKHLGKMQAIETAITTIAGYNGRFMFIIQSLSALTENYGQSGKENFLGNTGIQVFMATSDADTPEYIAKAIGEYTHTSRSKSWNSFETLKSNIQERHESAKLIRPEQIRLLDEDLEIVLIKGEPPLLINKVRFYKDKVLKRLFADQSGPFPEPAARSLKPATSPEAENKTQQIESASSAAKTPAVPAHPSTKSTATRSASAEVSPPTPPQSVAQQAPSVERFKALPLDNSPQAELLAKILELQQKRTE